MVALRTEAARKLFVATVAFLACLPVGASAAKSSFHHGVVGVRLSDQVDEYAAWSPDATKLVFAHIAAGLVKKNIYTAKLDGTTLTRLTFDTERSESSPAWTR